MSRRGTWILRALGVLALVVAIAGALVWRELRAMGFLRTPVYETEAPALPAFPRPAVLVFSKTNAFIHKDAIPAARAALAAIGADAGWSVHASDSGALFNPAALARFDVVVWNNVSGDVLTVEQRAAFRAWLEAGGGFVALHAAGDNSHADWPWYVEQVIRTRFIGHPLEPQFQPARIEVARPPDPIVAGLPAEWRRVDEWYSFARSPRAADLRVLATVDENSYAPGEFFGTPLAMGADHPLIWIHCVGRGRVFYSAAGHTAESYHEPEYLGVLLRAIGWAGRLQAPAADGGSLSCDGGADLAAGSVP